MEKKLNEKICIVGGGISGLSAAWFLQKKGYANVHILEKNERVGGKCNSPIYKGRTYETGAVIGLGKEAYPTTHKIMEEIRIEAKGPVPDRTYYDYKTGEECNLFTKEELVDLKKQMGKLAYLINTKYTDIKKPGHANCHPDLMETFKDFCEMHGIELLMRVWINPYTAYGYDYFDITPAAYVLQYIDVVTMQDFINLNVITWEQGTEGYCREIGEALINKPRLGINIEKVIRKDGKVYVYSNWGKEEFNKIIFTSSLQDIPKYVDVREEENDLFDRIKIMDYKTFTCLVKGNYPRISGYFQKNMTAQRAGHTMFWYSRWTEDHTAPITFYVMANPQEKINEADCVKHLKEDVKLLGMEITDIIHSKSLRYFPHLSCSNMREGWYDKIEALQGIDGTYYAGEVMSFSDIEECARYSEDLVNRFF